MSGRGASRDETAGLAFHVRYRRERKTVEQGGFRFQDDRQSELYELLLRLVGAGPAAFYRDACRQMASERPMETVTHQVGHLVREVDAGLLNMLGAVTADPEVEKRDPLAEGDRRERLEALLDTFEVPEDSRADKRHRLLGELVSDGRAKKIRSVLESLGLPADDPVAQSWIKPPSRGAHAWAHRDSLSPPRPPDERFRQFWERTQDVWYLVLTRFEGRFTDSFPLIDGLLRKEQPGARDVARLQETVPNTAVAYERFFDGMTDARWLQPLRRKGFFLHPTEPERDEEGVLRSAPPWPQAGLLARMADAEPELVASIFLDIPPTENIRVHEAAAVAARKMPPSLAAQLIPKAVEGLDLPFYSDLPTELAALVGRLAEGGLVEEALGLARELLTLTPEITTPETDLGDGLIWPAAVEPRARFHPPERYDEVVSECLMPLTGAVGERAVQALSDLLEEANRTAASPYLEEGESPPYEDGVAELVLAIEEAPGEVDYYDTRGGGARVRLLVAIRDAAEAIARSESATVPRLVEGFEARETETFDRLALNLLRMFPAAPGVPEITAKRLPEKLPVLTSGLWHEYARLLRDRFAGLPKEDQKAILRRVGEGPSREVLEEWRELRRTGGFDDEPTEDELDAYLVRRAEVWRVRRLAILDGQLPEGAAALYRELRERHGPVEEPLYLDARRVRLLAPRGGLETAAGLADMSIGETVSYLRGFAPGDGWEEPDVRDTAEELRNVVTAQPARFAAEAERFQTLEPDYVHALLWGLRDALQEASRQQEEGDASDGCGVGPTFPWRPVLGLCRWVLDQPRDREEERFSRGRHVGWGSPREYAAELLKGGLSMSGELPFELRGEVWTVLEGLAEDPEPTLGYEEERTGMSRPAATPSFFSINTVRGVAMHAVVVYALWVRRNLERSRSPFEMPWHGLSDVPEAREVLEKHLDPDVEPTRTVRSVYGYRLPQLVYLDGGWVEERLAEIFPGEDARAHLREAAWETYAAQWPPYLDTFEVLRGEYARAVERLEPDRTAGTRPDPEVALAEHLMALYRSDLVPLDEPGGLLNRFYEKASDGLRAAAAGFVGRLLQTRETDLPEEESVRLEALWDRRLASAVENEGRPYSEELAAFGWWFVSGKFDERRSLERLSRGLSLGANATRPYGVAERLAEVASHHPALAAECAERIVRGLLRPGRRERWAILGIESDLHDILRAAARSADEDARRTARETASILAANGYPRFWGAL